MTRFSTARFLFTIHRVLITYSQLSLFFILVFSHVPILHGVAFVAVLTTRISIRNSDIHLDDLLYYAGLSLTFMGK